MKALIFALLFLIATPVLATGGGCESSRNCHEPENGGVVATSTSVGIGVAGAESNSTANSTNTNTNTNSNTNEQGQLQGQLQGQQQSASSDQSQSQSASSDQSQSQSANNNGNSQAINIAAPKTYQNTPNVIAPNVFSSSVCQGAGFSAGAGVPGYGLSMGGAKSDKECNLRETARLLGGLGYDETGFVLLCQQIPAVMQANGGNCTPPALAPEHVVAPAAPIPVPVPVITEAVKG